MASVRLVRRSAQGLDPLSREGLFRQVGALVGAVLLGFLSMASREADPGRTTLLVQASTLTALAVVATLLVPWHRLPFPFHTVLPLVLLGVAHLALEATGGLDSPYLQLALLPMLWVSVYGTRWELGGMFLATCAVLGARLLTDLGGDEPSVQALAMLVGGGVVALMVHRFFGRIRSQTNRLQAVAGTDPLTGAANRRVWDEEIAAALARAARGGMPLSMALLDLDDFKSFNDRHGHQAGDRLLKEAAAGWRGTLRASDVLARLGGDEFAVLLPGCALEMAATIAEHLRGAAPADAACSVGVASWDGHESAHAFVARADRALYDAKERGRDRVVITSDDGVSVELAGGVPRAYRDDRV